MNTKKALVVGGILVAIISIGAGCFFWLHQPQTIVLSDGCKLTLEAVTYGKHHVFPKKDSRLRARTATLTTSNDTLCVWVRQEHKPNQWPQYQLLAYDADDTACAGQTLMSYGNTRGRQGTEIVAICFDAFPRREKKIYFRVQESNRGFGQPKESTSQFVIKNPARSETYPRWTPSTLPATEEDGDLSVTLTSLTYGAKSMNNNNQNVDALDPGDRAVHAGFRILQNGERARVWQPKQIETSDATGNRVVSRNWSSSRVKDEQILSYQWGLWPDEPAWKLRVELSRSSGFSPNEVWYVAEVPLTKGTINDTYRTSKTVPVFAEGTLGDTHLQLFQIVQLSGDEARRYGDVGGILRIHTEPPLEGIRLNLLNVTDGQNQPIEFYNWGSGGGDYRFALRNLGSVTNVNVKLAVHRSRFVEFTVKPPTLAKKKQPASQ